MEIDVLLTTDEEAQKHKVSNHYTVSADTLSLGSGIERRKS